jgi:hypothetical protein
VLTYAVVTGLFPPHYSRCAPGNSPDLASEICDRQRKGAFDYRTSGLRKGVVVRKDVDVGGNPLLPYPLPEGEAVSS